jgi:ubiquinone/menaquinone biosynthesis C-methylase UbiE
MPQHSPVDWQLPAGVTRGLWDYVNDTNLAKAYDANLADSALPAIDQRFCERQFPTPGRLLDLGCGTGRLLLTFARRGFWTLGVDLSSSMLRVAGEKAAAAGVSIHRLQANLVELGCIDENTFEYAACLFSTLGMVCGAEPRRRVVQHVYRVLKPGGKLVVHVHNRWFNFWSPGGCWWLIKDCLASLFLRHPGGDHVAPIHQGIAGLTLHLFTRREAIRLLCSVGFRIVEVMPLSLRPDGRLRCPWWFGGLRSHGYLLAAEKPLSASRAP